VGSYFAGACAEQNMLNATMTAEIAAKGFRIIRASEDGYTNDKGQAALFAPVGSQSSRIKDNRPDDLMILSKTPTATAEWRGRRQPQEQLR
jgi:hypothetical protein